MSQRPTPEQAALLIVLIFTRSKVPSRVRFSEKTLRGVAGRKNLRLSFLQALIDALDDLGFALLQIEAGWALIPVGQLNGAQAVTANKYISNELAERKAGNEIYTEIRKELGLDIEESDDED
ncbi:hypothetical protein [Variovorax sp. 770b2]|uniref:hypothetical protein n=1 Tax=Variovorax sp. 770b2 TaxID=1566271 RepID=UPI0008F0ED13|nr:hypothetical protein [Variovorax sp. 770b2]SFQ34413.1 hypothetical protein SAMN03159339_6870 [Variovorax sp. 770b2]